MGAGFRGELIMALAWLAFPLVPTILEDMYYKICVNLFGTSWSGPDPVDWEWVTWTLMLGPLLGYGFLAGSTAEVADEVGGPRRGLRRITSRRAVWVAIGPWGGFLVALGAVMGFWFVTNLLPDYVRGRLESLWGTSIYTALSRVTSIVLLGIAAYGWLWPAWAALRRAGRVGLWRRALYRGVVTALAFVGSLFGSFWAMTLAWRSFFFDPRVMPMIALALSLVALSGCSSTVTYGEMRRRELFHAMLLAWVFGLALIWWWSSRKRRKGLSRGDATSEDRGSS
jgi:hypothetical protein